jgi:hypothetical protein
LGQSTDRVRVSGLTNSYASNEVLPTFIGIVP